MSPTLPLQEAFHQLWSVLVSIMYRLSPSSNDNSSAYNKNITIQSMKSNF